MVLINVIIGPMEGVYIGNALDPYTPLTQIFSLRTLGGTLTYNIPQKHYAVAGTAIQEGKCTMECNLSFLSDDDSIVELAMGNFPPQVPANLPDTLSSFAQLTVLLLHPQGATRTSSILLPTCYAKKNLNLNWNKDKATAVPLTFQAEDRSRYARLFFKRANSDLAAILGPRYPTTF